MKGAEQRSTIMSYGEMARKFDPLAAEMRWQKDRHGDYGQTVRIPERFPRIEDHKFDSGIHPQFGE